MIIVVDDDPEIRDVVREYLVDEGFDVREAASGAQMFERIREKVPELVLLDLRLPDEDGFTLARILREKYPSVGIIVISGKEDLVDRVAALETGADDYIVKPFVLREVLARVRSLLRRRDPTGNGDAGEPAPPGPREAGLSLSYGFSGWTLDCGRRTLRSPQGQDVELTSGEFDLLLAFVSHANRALSREQLLDLARDGMSEAYDRSIDVQVARLRRKIEKNYRRPKLIKTIRNVGYMFQAEVTKASS
ncbi:MAG: response regulator transcription factor [Alphaproteobacteria bacterium]|nr:response regulator transcription factor [Alphaproteobacteria bacterium]